MAIGTTLKISFDAKSVQSGLSSIRSSITSIGKAGLGIAKIGAAFTAMGIAGIAAVGAIALKLDEIGSAGRSGDRRLQSITKQMGLFGNESEEVANRLIDAADAEAQLTGIDPQLVQTKLMTFNELAKTADQVGGAFDRATTAALDMQAAGFGDANQNAVQLGKALNDPIKGINSLARSGITFTAREKDKIKVLVESNKMLDAQVIILEAIEKQVGGTAAATATASSRLAKSFALVVESFAEPMSVAFDGIPEKFQAIMPKLTEIGGKAGTGVANAIADSIDGNHDKFVAAGKLIGDILSAATEASYQAGIMNLHKGIMKTLEDINPIRRMSEAVGYEGARGSQWETPSFGELLEAHMINRGIKQQGENVMRGNQGFVPGTNNRFQYAPPGSNSPLNDGNGNRVVEVLTRIEQNTKDGSKM